MLKSRVYNWFKFKQFVEIKCILCRGSTTFDNPLCALCISACPAPTCFCSACGLPIHHSDTGLCPQCLIEPPLFDSCLAPFLYEFPVNRMLQMIKYQARLELVRPIVKPLAELLVDEYGESPWPQAIIPVPLHDKRLRSRGYDQTLLLAKALIRQLPVEMRLDRRSVFRAKHAAPQQGLSAEQRQKNIRHAFALRGSVAHEHVALMDDVVTTGATVSEITRLLKKAGVHRVDVWAIARTPENA